MTEALNRSNARFGIEIRGLSLHAEAESLQDIHSLLRGHVGRVHVIDRQSKGLLLEGNIEQVRDALESLAKLNADGASVGSVEGA